jgi:hypothetical protein
MTFSIIKQVIVVYVSIVSFIKYIPHVRGELGGGRHEAVCTLAICSSIYTQPDSRNAPAWSASGDTVATVYDVIGILAHQCSKRYHMHIVAADQFYMFLGRDDDNDKNVVGGVVRGSSTGSSHIDEV